MAEGVSRWFLAREAWPCFRASPCGIWTVALVQAFLQVLRFLQCSILKFLQFYAVVYRLSNLQRQNVKLF